MNTITQFLAGLTNAHYILLYLCCFVSAVLCVLIETKTKLKAISVLLPVFSLIGGMLAITFVTIKLDLNIGIGIFVVWAVFSSIIIFPVIGQIASPVRTMEDGIGKLSVQATLGMIKVPIQKINLNLRVEKNDESGNKLAGVDMALYKYKTVTAKHVAQQVTPTPIEPTVTGQQVVYRTHVQNVGWQPYVANATMSGTSGRSLRLEGLRIKLNNQKYNGTVLYRTHIQNIGWLGWAKNGESAGTAGYGYRLEGMQIVLVEKGQDFYSLNPTRAKTAAFVSK